jgi:hypothetical protein
VLASYGLDVVWPVLLLLGVERVRIDPGNTAFTQLDFESYPWSHSLLMAVAWGLLAGGIAWLFSADRRVRIVVALLVVSHWVLDLSTHRPDLPLWPGGSMMVGLGLWYSIPATLIVEGALFAVAIGMYLQATHARDRVGSIAFWAFVALQFTIWISQPWSPPPPSMQAIAWVGIVAWIFPVWAEWFDRHRTPRA